MTKYITEGTDLTAVANAIRVKSGGSSSLSFPDGFINEIGSISGSAEAPIKEVNFFDFDGTCLYSYTKAEALALDALPDNPTPKLSSLVADGWNYTLAQMKTQVTNVGACDIGQLYKTKSGAIEIDVKVNLVTKNIGIMLGKENDATTRSVTVDWGDSSTDNYTISSSGTTITHIYSSVGNYTISISYSGGYLSLYSSSSSKSFVTSPTNTNYYTEYQACVQAIRFNAGYQYRGNAFPTNTQLKYITFPSDTTAINNEWNFQNDYGLQFLVLPPCSYNNYFPNIYYCYSLKGVSIPLCFNVSPSNPRMSYCYALERLVLPTGIENVNNNAFQRNYTLKEIYLSDTHTTMGTAHFQYNQSLTKISFPSTVTSLGTNYFSSCQALVEYHFASTSPPTIQSTTFSNLAPEAKIYVPSASLTTYQAANNWSNYSTYMVGE